MDTEELIAFVQQETFNGYLDVAAFSLLVYDVALSFPKEISYVWQAPWSPGKVLYIFVRYAPLLVFPFDIAVFSMFQPVDSNCRLTLYWYSWGWIILSLAGDAVVGLRTWVIWNKSPFVGAALLLLLTGIAPCVMYLNYSFLEEVSFAPAVPGFNGCIMQISTSLAAVSRLYFPLVTYQVVIFIATIARGIGHLRHSPAALTTVLYRDAISVASIILPLYGTGIAWSFVSLYPDLNLIIPARIILNIREAALGVDDWEFSARETTVVGTSDGSHSSSPDIALHTLH